MSERIVRGRARVLGDDVNTDYIISSRRKKESLNAGELRHFLLEDLDPAFAASVSEGDILVAGRNFGCGSAMEVAVTVLLGAGIQAVVAKSFSRTYWRNAVNNGLLLVVADTSSIAEGAVLALHLHGTRVDLIDDADPPNRIACEPASGFVISMLAAGGLVPYLRHHRRLA